jgi:XRE family aerobic/anaerobic benzoate catabolism transcriptional regulator
MLKPVNPSLKVGLEKNKGSNEMFLKDLGSRIRKARSERKITRRALSEVSGVSERYLALLESGQGNISIVLLRQVAISLGVSPESLISDSGSLNSDAYLISEIAKGLSRNKLAELRKLVLHELKNDPTERSTRIALIGLRGAGKTTVGGLLSTSTDSPFVELDQEIENSAGCNLSEIFMTYGQDGYRNLEKSCLENLLSSSSDFILATGGSIVQEPSTYELLLSTCFTVWLKADPEEHMERVISQGDTRPMAGNLKAMDQLKSILSERESAYSRADLTIETSGRQPGEILSEITAHPNIRPRTLQNNRLEASV